MDDPLRHRGVAVRTVKRLQVLDVLSAWPLDKLKALHRVAKTTPFFKDPRQMQALRNLMEAKELAKRWTSTSSST